MKNTLFFLVAIMIVTLSGCYISTYPTGGGGGGYPQQQPVWQTADQHYQHNYQNERCYFRARVSRQGITRDGNMIGFYHSGVFCYATITEQDWQMLQNNYTIEVLAYHHP